MEVGDNQQFHNHQFLAAGYHRNDMMTTAAAGGGGDQQGRPLKIKIKLPNTTRRSLQDYGAAGYYYYCSSSNDAPIAAAGTEDDKGASRICSVCNKSFGSGKALGGHMRIHSSSQLKQEEEEHGVTSSTRNNNLNCPKQQQQQQQLMMMMIQKIPPHHQTNHHHHHHLSKSSFHHEPNSSSIDHEILKTTTSSTTCSLCGKTFPSMKSLFGHMRCHPERAWRGIQPPPTAVAAASITHKIKFNTAAAAGTTSSVSDSRGALLATATLVPRLVHDSATNNTAQAAAVTALPPPPSSSSFDLLAHYSLPKWSKKAKRGRKSTTTTTSSSSTSSSMNIHVAAAFDHHSCNHSDDGHKIPEVVYDLMMLAHQAQAQAHDGRGGGGRRDSMNANQGVPLLSVSSSNSSYKNITPTIDEGSGKSFYQYLSKKRTGRHDKFWDLAQDRCVVSNKKLRVNEGGSSVKTLPSHKGINGGTISSDQFYSDTMNKMMVYSGELDYTRGGFSSDSGEEEEEEEDSEWKCKEEEPAAGRRYNKMDDAYLMGGKVNGLIKKKKKIKFRDLWMVRDNKVAVMDYNNKQEEGEEMKVVVKGCLKYKCSTCNKCFDSHQALGGHRSSHNKRSNIKNNLTINQIRATASGGDGASTDEEDEEDEEEELYQQCGKSYRLQLEEEKKGGGRSSKVVSRGGAHRCKICGKTFPTGQALGGHKRSHWNAHVPLLLASSHGGEEDPEAVTTPSSGSITLLGTSSQSQQQQQEETMLSNQIGLVLDFDLNELPMVETE